MNGLIAHFLVGYKLLKAQACFFCVNNFYLVCDAHQAELDYLPNGSAMTRGMLMCHRQNCLLPCFNSFKDEQKAQ